MLRLHYEAAYACCVRRPAEESFKVPLPSGGRSQALNPVPESQDPRPRPRSRIPAIILCACCPTRMYAASSTPVQAAWKPYAPSRKSATLAALLDGPKMRTILHCMLPWPPAVPGVCRRQTSNTGMSIWSFHRTWSILQYMRCD